MALGGAVDGLVPGTVHPEAVSRTVKRATTVSDVRRMTADERGWFQARSEPLEPLRPLGRWRPGPVAYEAPLIVRWTDLDSYGHVNNVRFFDFVAEAREHMSSDDDRSSNRMSAAEEVGQLWMVVRQDVDYLVSCQAVP